MSKKIKTPIYDKIIINWWNNMKEIDRVFLMKYNKTYYVLNITIEHSYEMIKNLYNKFGNSLR